MQPSRDAKPLLTGQHHRDEPLEFLDFSGLRHSLVLEFVNFCRQVGLLPLEAGIFCHLGLPLVLEFLNFCGLGRLLRHEPSVFRGLDSQLVLQRHHLLALAGRVWACPTP